MALKFEFYYLSEVASKSLRMKTCQMLLDSEGLSYTSVCNPELVIKITKGAFRPDEAFVIVCRDEVIGSSVYALCAYIERNGLRLC